MIGQIGRGLNGDWKVIPTHEDIHREAIVSLAEAPEILQSIDQVASYSKLNLIH